jgi:hypothetical protein
VVLLLHPIAAPQVPFAVHVCTPLPMHCVAPGEHTPVHAPEAHAWLVHVAAAPHCPVESHVCTPLAEH